MSITKTISSNIFELSISSIIYHHMKKVLLKKKKNKERKEKQANMGGLDQNPYKKPKKR